MSGILEGKVCVVTGGVSGMGLATVEKFLSEGASVAVGDIQDDLGKALEARLGKKFAYLHTDVTSESDIEALVTTAADTFGSVDVMFSNAGAGGDLSPVIDLTADGLNSTLALNLNSHVYAHKHAGRQFIKQGTGGSIISTSSTAGVQAGWAAAGYSMAKAAVLALVRASALELGPHGVRVNAIVPGLVLTPIHAKYASVPDERADDYLQNLDAQLGSKQPVGRAGQPDDIATAALFLASDQSAFMSAVSMPVDGGALATTAIDFASGAAEARASLGLS